MLYSDTPSSSPRCPYYNTPANGSYALQAICLNMCSPEIRTIYPVYVNMSQVIDVPTNCMAFGNTFG